VLLVRLRGIYISYMYRARTYEYILFLLPRLFFCSHLQTHFILCSFFFKKRLSQRERTHHTPSQHQLSRFHFLVGVCNLGSHTYIHHRERERENTPHITTTSTFTVSLSWSAILDCIHHRERERERERERCRLHCVSVLHFQLSGFG
jgi:hypothetical protein